MMRHRWWTARAWLVTGVLAVTAIGVVVSLSGIPARAQQGDVAALARRFIGGPGGEQSVTLMVGQLAPNFPLSLPLPPGANVVGTIARDFGNGMSGWEVVLDVPGNPMEAGQFFERALPGLGWQQPAGQEGPAPGLFCQSDSGPWIGVIAVPVSEQMSDVRIHAEAGNPGPCAGPPPQQ